MGIMWGANGGRCTKRDKKKKSGRASSTPGSSKGENCKASSWDRFFATYARAVRDPGYKAWSKRNRGH